jgi:hypothetical protein
MSYCSYCRTKDHPDDADACKTCGRALCMDVSDWRAAFGAATWKVLKLCFALALTGGVLYLIFRLFRWALGYGPILPAIFP